MSEKKSKLQRKLARLRVTEVYDKATDSVKVVFKFADRATIKAYLKQNLPVINPDVLPKEYKTFVKQVAAGRKRQAAGVKIGGKFISNKFLAVNHFEERARLKGFKTAKELFENDKRDFDAAVKLYLNPKGFNNEFTSNAIVDAIDTFGGKFTINGKPATKKECILQMAGFDSYLKRRFGSFYNTFTVNFTLGGAQMNLTIPTGPDEIEDEDFEGEGVAITKSPAKGSNPDEEFGLSDLDKQGRPKPVYEYKIKSYNEKGNRVTTKIKAAGKDAAIFKFADKKPNDTLINIAGGNIKNKNVV